MTLFGRLQPPPERGARGRGEGRAAICLGPPARRAARTSPRGRHQCAVCGRPGTKERLFGPRPGWGKAHRARASLRAVASQASPLPSRRAAPPRCPARRASGSQRVCWAGLARPALASLCRPSLLTRMSRRTLTASPRLRPHDPRTSAPSPPTAPRGVGCAPPGADPLNPRAREQGGGSGGPEAVTSSRGPPEGRGRAPAFALLPTSKVQALALAETGHALGSREWGHQRQELSVSAAPRTNDGNRGSPAVPPRSTRPRLGRGIAGDPSRGA